MLLRVGVFYNLHNNDRDSGGHGTVALPECAYAGKASKQYHPTHNQAMYELNITLL